MSSALGMKKKTPEELIKLQGGESYKGKPGETVRITGGRSDSSYSNYAQRSGIASRNYNILDNGKLVINPGVEEYKWNDRLKRYDAIRGRGRGYLLVGQVNAQEKEDSGGGGGSGEAQASAPAASIMNVGAPGGTVIPGTYEGGSGGSVGLLQISPGAVNWKPQVGTLNPLADPNNFYANLDPIQMPQEQRYIDPSLMLI